MNTFHQKSVKGAQNEKELLHSLYRLFSCNRLSINWNDTYIPIHVLTTIYVRTNRRTFIRFQLSRESPYYVSILSIFSNLIGQCKQLTLLTLSSSLEKGLICQNRRHLLYLYSKYQRKSQFSYECFTRLDVQFVQQIYPVSKLLW